jgi:glycosyltransferase involved in cell wall biosynthesis
MEQAFINYAENLILQGNEVICVIKTDTLFTKELEIIGAKIYKVQNRFGYCDYPLIWKIRGIIKKEKIDVVIGHAGRAISIGKRAAKKICPMVAVNHSSNVKRSIGCDAVFVINNVAKDNVVQKDQSENSVFLIPNMIKLPKKLPERKKEGRELIIGSLGRFVKAKGFAQLIEAISILKKDGIRTKLILAGDGEEKENLQALIKEKNLEDNVKLLGWVDDKNKFFDSFDIFCLPSLFEPFGIVLLEAMLYEKPIVATNSEGPNDIFTHGKDAIIVSKDNIEYLAQDIAYGLKRVIEDEKLRKTLGQNARKNLERNYSMKSVGLLLNKTLKQIIKSYN